jgi:hypothetical protein
MENMLCAKEVGKILGLSSRSACRLMASGKVQSCRVGRGERALRTTLEKVTAYQARQFKRAGVGASRG